MKQVIDSMHTFAKGQLKAIKRAHRIVASSPETVANFDDDTYIGVFMKTQIQTCKLAKKIIQNFNLSRDRLIENEEDSV